MLAYEKLGEGGGSSPETPDIPRDIQERLEKVAIAIDSSTFRRINKDPSVYEIFLKDLSALEANPSEKARFELLYLKGYGQVVKIDGVEYTFAKIAEMKEEEQMRLVASIQSPLEKMKVGNFIRQVAIDANKGKLMKQQVAIDANGEREKRLKINQDLEKSLTEIKKIKGVPSPPPEELQKNAETIPELKGANPEEVQSGKYDNILLADYYDRNSASIVVSIPSEEDRRKFEQSLTNIRTTIGRPVPFDKLTESIVLGSGREQVESRGRELIDKGYSKDVIWDKNDRTITFTNNLGEKRVIETARIPPRERVEKNGLSISRDILPIDNSVEKKRTLEAGQIAKRREVAIDYAGLRIIPSGSFPKELKDEGARHVELYRKFDQAGTPVARYNALSELLASNRAIEVRRRDRDVMTTDNMGVLGQFEKPIQDERVTLERLLKSLTSYIAGERELSKYANIPNKTDNFDSTARANLEWLTSETVLFQRMGGNANEALYRIVNEVNFGRRDKSNQILLSEKSVSEVDKRRLKSAYAMLIKNLGYDPAVLKRADIGEFQKKVTESLGKERTTSGSLENLMKPKSSGRS